MYRDCCCEPGDIKEVFTCRVKTTGGMVCLVALQYIFGLLSIAYTGTH